ncbi:hypothetical protein GIB67_009482 [Kingdonia uniflora]|uniref:SAM domain-containing protein n=1 Tax=Kingdonia uniflora TaxID=39325 RepID=A0A7J7N398_9MAGN|nr:hypothetical protein GIB67_009482 [Kingdonia uniflora]
MAELQPPEGTTTINGGGPIITVSDNLAPSLASKRQRRPSVRLGDIGDQPATLSYDHHYHLPKRTKQWHDLPKYRNPTHRDTGKSSKTRPLMTLGNNDNNHELLEIDDKKSKRGGGATKRVRTNWVSSKVDEGIEEKFSGDEEGYRDFDPLVSESPLREGEHSPIHSLDNPGVNDSDRKRRTMRSRVSESRDHEGVELDGLDEPLSDTDARDWRCRSLEDGIQMWLNGLGLSRYAPVFEIHEVDEDVLPLLTLDDLKDMGINAVGSRRKLYSAIQKLAKGFS